MYVYGLALAPGAPAALKVNLDRDMVHLGRLPPGVPDGGEARLAGPPTLLLLPQEALEAHVLGADVPDDVRLPPHRAAGGAAAGPGRGQRALRRQDGLAGAARNRRLRALPDDAEVRLHPLAVEVLDDHAAALRAPGEDRAAPAAEREAARREGHAEHDGDLL